MRIYEHTEQWLQHIIVLYNHSSVFFYPIGIGAGPPESCSIEVFGSFGFVRGGDRLLPPVPLHDEERSGHHPTSGSLGSLRFLFKLHPQPSSLVCPSPLSITQSALA